MFLSFLFRLMMKLQCEVEVINRMLPTFGMRNRGKGTRAVLSIGRHQDKATKTTSVYLLVCTLKDKAGSKYKLKENIEQFFTKFLEEGKATVRLKEPAVDVCLSKADASNLKNFLSALRLAHRGNDIENLPLSTLAPAKTSEIEKPKTKLVVTSKKDYPLTTNFPYSLEHLQVSYCKLARVDMRMLCLKKLRKLDLSHNHIKKLPATIGDLVFLQELILHNNHLESFNVRLCSSTLQKSLQFLDLSQNKLQALPLQFCQLRELVHLKLDDNELIRLPFKIGQFCKLRFLSAAHNKLPYLPRDFKRLCLENLDLFGNPFEQPNPLAPSIQLKIPLTLLEITARSVVNYRIPYGPCILPAHLCQDLNVAKTCTCGRACLNFFIETTVTMNLHHVSHTVVLVDNMGGTEAPLLCYFCSLTCYSEFLDDFLQRTR
ncbi:leucine-rich repeat protein 1 isoform X1 [Latimeria chalumnae]|uniref:leucine-rich repeat protein 1 isoform X1 n=1 Tax=Latimeria chalumnae TaxID=7897 RepID=UPI0003C1989C|nr:PREDICTED: leucine-rich repeat protein 1 isoform X2 [Latimeria chalumnae]|eukprot:XP_005995032.1 PREDICTED: leucine-rich repeat protein 1 isoform X2 [Latimeria chalumnae]